MENGNNPAEKMAEEVVDELVEINKNKRRSKRFRSARQFHEQKDNFVISIINESCTDKNKEKDFHAPGSSNNPNKSTKKKYNDLKFYLLQFYLLHCSNDYRAQLVKKWNKTKKEDKTKFADFISTYYNFDASSKQSRRFEIQNESDVSLRFDIDTYEIGLALKEYGYARNEWGRIYKIRSSDN